MRRSPRKANWEDMFTFHRTLLSSALLYKFPLSFKAKFANGQIIYCSNIRIIHFILRILSYNFWHALLWHRKCSTNYFVLKIHWLIFKLLMFMLTQLCNYSWWLMEVHSDYFKRWNCIRIGVTRSLKQFTSKKSHRLLNLKRLKQRVSVKGS